MAPDLLADRFPPGQSPDGLVTETSSPPVERELARHIGWAMVLLGGWGTLACTRRVADGKWARDTGWVVVAAAVYGCLSLLLADWIIDDAAITFAYADNFASGHGMVLHPNLPAEEGCSSLIWLLTLAGCQRMGLDIASAAKWVGWGLGLGSLLAVMIGSSVALRDRRPPEGRLIVLAIALGAPFVVWTNSGLEHSLQAFMFVLMVVSPLITRHHATLVGWCLGLLVLTRPETPLLALVVFCLYCQTWRAEGLNIRAIVRKGALMFLPVVLAGVGLLLLRILYFGDLLPNPYYAKASNSNLLRILNVVGGGWHYLWRWFADSGALCVLGVWLLGGSRKAPLPEKLAWGLIGGQLTFVIIVADDWMGQYRFIAPILPVFALATAWSLNRLAARVDEAKLRTVLIALCGVVAVNTTSSLLDFLRNPTTPMDAVADVGRRFDYLARELGVDHPTLAHHDAGATSYINRIEVVDLGGLGSRVIAKHMSDRAFMADYLLEKRKPTFMFGARHNFAAGLSKFYKDPRFKERYVPIRFVRRGEVVMTARARSLCHVRRDLLENHSPRVELKRFEDGKTWAVVELPDDR